MRLREAAVFLKIFANLAEKNCVGVSFKYSCRPEGLQLY